jgi:hypothetical protein
MAWGHSPGPNPDGIGQEISGFERILYALAAISVAGLGFYVACGRFMIDARRRANTSYGLTPERILIISRAFKTTVASIALDNLGRVAFSRHDDGSGTIRFGERSRLRPWHLPGLPVTAQPEFERIANVRRVLYQIAQAQRGALPPRAHTAYGSTNESSARAIKELRREVSAPQPSPAAQPEPQSP